MIHQFFYEGRYMGEVLNPVLPVNHLWICKHCGRTFAVRTNPQAPKGFYIWEVFCAKCAKQDEYIENKPSLLAEFRRGGDVSDQLPTLRAQFLYECEVFYG